MISAIKSFSLGILLCVGFSGINAYPSHATDVSVAVNQKVDDVANALALTLSLKEWRDVNILASGFFGLSTLLATANDDAPAFTVALSLCLYNMYRAIQRTAIIRNLEDIKKIVHNHITHLYGYVR